MLASGPLDVSPKSIRAKSESDSQAIYRDLKAAIRSGAFGTGSRLPTERLLATQFGAARNTVRKTMDQLAREGLIVRQVGRGTFVSSAQTAKEAAVSQDFNLAELLEARLLFEPSLPDLVVERATASDLAAMDRSLQAMRQAEDWVEFKEAKYGLHMAIARASQNRLIISMFEQILASRRRAGWGRPGGHPSPVFVVREAAFRDNAEIVAALKVGDGATARDLIRNYLLRTLSASSGS